MGSLFRYTQMSGRAGRRGIDAHGIVIIAGDELIEPSRLEAIILGQPPKLVSQFGMTYSMLLNLIRNPDRTSYAQMISQSFASYRARMASAQLHSARARLEAQLAALPLPTPTPRRALLRAADDAEMASSTISRGAADAEMASSTISRGAADADAAVESGGGGNHGNQTQSDAITSSVRGGGGTVTIERHDERHDERATLATYFDLLEAATSTALDLIRAARSLPGGGRRLLPSGRVVVTRDVGDARDGAVVRPRLALLLTAMTEDLPPPPHASPQTLPVPGGPLPHATREGEEAASPPVPQVPPPEPPSVHASAHHGAPLSPPQVPPRASSAPASMPAAPTTAATGPADAATVATKSAAAARLRCLIASQENGASPHPLDGFGVAPRVHARPPWRPPTRLACGTGAVVGAMVGGGNQGAMVGGGYEGADGGKDGGAGGDEGDEGAVVGGCGGRITGRRGGRGAGRGGRGGRGASACTAVHLPGASAAAASSAPSMTWEIVEIEASHIIALSTLRLNVPQSLATATALDLASVGAETGAHHGAALLKLAQQLSLLQRKHRFLPVPLIDPIADVHLSAQPTSACEMTAAAASASDSASASASAAASAAAAAAAPAAFAPAAAPAEKGRGGRSGRGLGVVVGGRGGRGGRGVGVSVTAMVAMGAADGAAGTEVGGSSRVGDDGAVVGESDGSGAVVGESDGSGAVVGESDGSGAGYPSPLAAMVARLSRSLHEHRSALQAHPYCSHAEIAILISAEAQRRALLGEIAEIDRVRLRDCEIVRL